MDWIYGETHNKQYAQKISVSIPCVQEQNPVISKLYLNSYLKSRFTKFYFYSSKTH